MPLIVALAQRSLVAISGHQAELVPLVTPGHSGLDRAWPVALCLTRPLINGNFSVDHRALISLTNYLLVMDPGVVFTLHLFVTFTFAVAEESCGQTLDLRPVIYHLSRLNLRASLLYRILYI